MVRCVGAAAMPGIGRKDLAVQVLAGSATVSDLSTRHGVSRKFVYQRANMERCVLDDAFISAATDDTVLFQIQVSKGWLRQVIVALALMCRGSYLGIREFMSARPASSSRSRRASSLSVVKPGSSSATSFTRHTNSGTSPAPPR
jgi:hypothetical protein